MMPRKALTLSAVTIALSSVASAAAVPGPYFGASFDVQRNPVTFGQTPSWTTDGGVLSNEPDRAGVRQVYISRLNGAGQRCLTCGRLPGPIGFPRERPQGDWMLFCSMGAQPQHLGGPCLGGYGGDLYVMRTNPDAGSAGTPMFLADFSDPLFTADLYMVDVGTGAVRRLTNFGQVIPEFEWNFDLTRLLWTENLRSGRQITRVARFAGLGRGARHVPHPPAPGLFGRPIDMRRVGGAIEPPRSGSLSAAPIAHPVALTPAGDRQSLPPVVISYVALLQSQLHDLAAFAARRIVQPPL